MTELIGMVVPAVLPLLGSAEHTYVVSSDGDGWRCGGRKQGGRAICRGQGHVRLARCLARPDEAAGIRYLWTGLCHQMANQILWPAGRLVSEAMGYSFSSSFYTHYGLGAWRQLSFCCQLLDAEHLLAERGPEGMSRPPKTPKSGLEESEAAYAMSSERELLVQDRLSMLNERLDRHLGRALERAERARLEQITIASAHEQYELLHAAERRELDPEAYFQRLTMLLKRTFSDIDKVLGREDFLRVFGAPPDAAVGIVDPVAFADAHGLKTPPRVPD